MKISNIFTVYSFSKNEYKMVTRKFFQCLNIYHWKSFLVTILYSLAKHFEKGYTVNIVDIFIDAL